MSTEINILLQKLDTFIKKYYINELQKGLILFVGISLFYFLSIFLLESIAYLSTQIRTVLFYSSIVLSIFGLLYYIIIPLLKLVKIGKTVSYEEAAVIISQHFPEIKDSLLNTLQLSYNQEFSENALAIAAINQKISKLKPIPFSLAINTKKLYTYLSYSGIAVGIMILVYIFYPGVLASGATRIIKYSEVFEKPAPFTFTLTNESTHITRGDDFTAQLTITGEYVPQRVYFVVGNTAFIMQQSGKNTFEYTTKNCNNSFNFNFRADAYSSQQYTVTVNPTPQLLQFAIDVKTPQYTQIEDFTVQNTAEITVPAGSILTWNISAADTDSLYSIETEQNKKYRFNTTSSGFQKSIRLLKSSRFKLQGKNTYFETYDIIEQNIRVIPDVYPSIQTVSYKDSLHFFTTYFRGKIQDDYGFSRLQFVWYKSSQPDSLQIVPIQFNRNSPIQEFSYIHDFSGIHQQDSMYYYFEVFDNDAIHGPKSARTAFEIFYIPTARELQERHEELSSKTEQNLQSSLSITQEILQEIEQARLKLLNQNLSDWERTQLMQEMQNNKKKLQQTIDDLQKSFDEKHHMQKQFDPQQQELLEKQQQIQDLLENLMNEELQKLFDEFNKLMQDFKRDEFFKLSEDMKLSFEELSRQLDRDLELLKRADIEQKMNYTAQELEKLAEEQQKLADEMLKQDYSQEELLDWQKDIEDMFEHVEDYYKDIMNQNEELKNSFNLDSFEHEFKSIQENIQENKEHIEKNNKNKGSKNMNETSEQMEKLSQAMQNMMKQQSAQQQMEDIGNLRRIIDNLLTFSFEQEELISTTQTLSFRDSRYAETAAHQNYLRENYTIIKDSIYNLSMRIPQISAPIQKEMFDIFRNLNHAVHHLEQRQRPQAIINQRYIMTSVNNVILLLSEILHAMQEGDGDGDGSCDSQCSSSKPGKGKPSFENMQQMQQSLQEQMQRMIEQMKDGSLQQGQGAQQLSQMLSQQEMLRQMMNTMIKEGGLNPETVKQLQEIQQLMDRVEHDIVNQNISQQTLFRQQQILTRLLESEKAEQERDQEQRREGQEAKDISRTPDFLLEQEKSPLFQYQDVLEQTNMQLKSYYKKIFGQYLLKIDEN